MPNSSISPINLNFHHTGLLVESIVDSLVHYTVLFGEDHISEIFHVKSQNVKVCFIKNGTNSFIELVEATQEDSVVYKLFKKRVSYYHLAYTVKDIHEAISFLEEQNYKALELFNSEAFSGNLCVFLYNPDGHLIELIEEK